MAGKKSEQIKRYIVIGLALVLVISLYFRFIHAKVKNSADPVPSALPLAPLNIPLIKWKNQQNAQSPESHDHNYLQDFVRDIFSPLKPPVTTKNQTKKQEPPQEKPAPTFKLKGTIVGGKNPIAIIDNQFVRTGDSIGEYRVARIGKKEVLLDSGDKKITLEILKNE